MDLNGDTSLLRGGQHLFRRNLHLFGAPFWQRLNTSRGATLALPQEWLLANRAAPVGVGSERLERWTDDQKQIVRRVVETFQNVRPAAPIDPLKEALGDRDPRQAI